MAEMTEPGELALPPVADPLEPPPPHDSRSGSARPGQTLAIAAAGVVLALLALLLAWQNGRGLSRRVRQVEQAQQQQAQQQAQQPPPPPQIDPAKLAQLTDQVQALTGRITALEARPQPTPTPVSVQRAPEPPPPPPAPPSVDLKPLEDRIATLEQRPAPVVPDDSALKGQVQGLLGQLDGLRQRVQAAQAQASDAADRALRAQQLQSAGTALDIGRPLGAIAGAPAALSRFAATPPPTEAALRLAFPVAARQADAASRPSMAGKSLAQRMWTRAESLVTVRQGSEVLVGPPAAATLASAQQRLDAGDLGGAVQALNALDPAATEAMKPWRQQAKALLDARAALAASVAALARG